MPTSQPDCITQVTNNTPNEGGSTVYVSKVANSNQSKIIEENKPIVSQVDIYNKLNTRFEEEVI